MMRKLVTIGLSSGKMLGFQILSEDVDKTIEMLVPSDNEDLMVDIKELVIKEQNTSDVLLVRPIDIEMLSIGDVPILQADNETPLFHPGG